jgi:hypothetical protein
MWNSAPKLNFINHRVVNATEQYSLHEFKRFSLPKYPINFTPRHQIRVCFQKLKGRRASIGPRNLIT